MIEVLSMLGVTGLFWGIAGGVLYRLRGWGYWDQNVLEGRATWALGVGLAEFALTGSWMIGLAAFAGGWIGLLRHHGTYFGINKPWRDVPMMALIGLYQSAWYAAPMWFYNHSAAYFLIACGPLMGLTYWLGTKIPRGMVRGDYITYSEIITGFQIMACLFFSIVF